MIRTEIVCDHCGFNGAISNDIKKTPAHVLRRKLKIKGNWHVGLPGGQDFCDVCWPVWLAHLEKSIKAKKENLAQKEEDIKEHQNSRMADLCERRK